MPAGAAATLLGGWLVRRLRLARHQLLAACCALQLANIPLVGSPRTTLCDPELAGVHVPAALPRPHLLRPLHPLLLV